MVKNEIGRTWRFLVGEGKGGRGVRRGLVGGRPRPAVLRIAERGRRNILILLIIFCLSIIVLFVHGMFVIEKVK
jgi:hypothetical protein